MRRAEGIVFAFGALGKTVEPAGLTQRANPVAPAGQNLVRIGLVTYVPDEPVIGRVEHMMYGNGEFHHTKAGTQMSASDRDRVDGFAAKLVGELFQLVVAERPGVGGRHHRIQERCMSGFQRSLLLAAAIDHIPGYIP